MARHVSVQRPATVNVQCLAGDECGLFEIQDPVHPQGEGMSLEEWCLRPGIRGDPGMPWSMHLWGHAEATRRQERNTPTGPLHVADGCGAVCATPAKWAIGPWKLRRTERILKVRNPRGFPKEALMRCLHEGPS
jgi:hypothetical protein